MCVCVASCLVHLASTNRGGKSSTNIYVPMSIIRARANMTGIAVGLTKGHGVSRRKLATRPAQRKGKLGKRVKMIRDLVRDVAGSAPYEKRLMELLKVGRDKRALKLAKRKLGTHLRGKKKREEMGNLLRKMSRKAVPTTA